MAKVKPRKKDLGIFSDDWGREPETRLELQFPKEPENLRGANAWGESNESSEPKPRSNQDRLKDLFDEHAE